MLSLCSLEVPKLFPKRFPIAPQFYPIGFALSSTLMYINWKGRLWRSAFVSMLQLKVQRDASIGECSQCSKKHCWWANELSLFPQKKKKLWTYPWITLCPQYVGWHSIGCKGLLGHAKNSDKLVWEEKFHAANGKAQASTQGAFLFFLLSFGEGRIFFVFPWFQCVPTMFPLSSQWVHIRFPMCSPTCSP
jgi:hypothetical protein